MPNERFMRHHYGASGYVPHGSVKSPLEMLIAQFSDLAVELEKHSNDHIHDELPDNLGAAVEGVCADRINAILKLYRQPAAAKLDAPASKFNLMLRSAGIKESARVFAWDADSEKFEEVTGIIIREDGDVELQTDDNS